MRNTSLRNLKARLTIAICLCVFAVAERNASAIPVPPNSSAARQPLEESCRCSPKPKGALSYCGCRMITDNGRTEVLVRSIPEAACFTQRVPSPVLGGSSSSSSSSVVGVSPSVDGRVYVRCYREPAEKEKNEGCLIQYLNDFQNLSANSFETRQQATNNIASCLINAGSTVHSKIWDILDQAAIACSQNPLPPSITASTGSDTSSEIRIDLEVCQRLLLFFDKRVSYDCRPTPVATP